MLTWCCKWYINLLKNQTNAVIIIIYLILTINRLFGLLIIVNDAVLVF